MKKRHQVFLVLFLMLATAVNVFACSKQVNVAWNKWEPFFMMAGKGQPDGLDAIIMDLLLKAAGCPYSLQEIPGRRALQLLKEGKIDMVTAASITEERQKYGYFSEPYRREVMLLIFRKGEAAKYPAESLFELFTKYNVKVGASNGAYYGPEFQKLLEDKRFKPKIHLTTSPEQRMKLLEAGRLTAVVDDQVAATFLTRQMKLVGKFEFHPLVVHDNSIHLLFSKRSVPKEDVELINIALFRLQKSFAYQHLIRNYTDIASDN
ncbi:substrate-binding periplasmic protein [Spartinivicinus poritis]|uniref:Transporter substrate-binding domain-containing protein n=1 Tax=Spartinivicinus poritis TaxID=2994640 RepID=A0ABT5UCS3_9GAMM|nr:transporter substrate-binding domain-containing protein [Spartinivicinus sp. A2-2]MDE1464178.1 transporter substrate-binding domain-containing protein [Spartinivicinus sp. A2-2]